MSLKVVGIITIATMTLLIPNVALAGTVANGSSSDNNYGFLVAAFAVAWLGLFAYFFYLDRTQRDLRRDLAELRANQPKRSPRKAK